MGQREAAKANKFPGSEIKKSKNLGTIFDTFHRPEKMKICERWIEDLLCDLGCALAPTFHQPEKMKIGQHWPR
jgi:hypothetical protein